MLQSEYEVIVIGAGHAGLAASYYLKKEHIHHVVLEQGHIGETWRSQRWDSFSLNTPNDLNILPGDVCHGIADAFPNARELVMQFESYVKQFELPVVENVRVKSVERLNNEHYKVKAMHEGIGVEIVTKQIVVASGAQNVPVLPSFANRLDASIVQLHGADYKNAKQLPAGNCLVAGSGQTGCQIVEDLLDNGRKVFLSTSKVGRIPRRYRGRDVMHWFLEAGMFDVTPDMITDLSIFENRAPQVSGTGRYGHTVSLQSLHAKGAVILGRIKSANGHTLYLESNAHDHVAFGDKTSMQSKAAMEQYIASNKIIAAENEPDPADIPDDDCASASNVTQLDLVKENITSIIWCSGFTGDYRYLKLPVLNDKGMPIHKDGITTMPGIFFLGIYWLRSRKSGIILGITDDAAFIVQAIQQRR